MEKWYKLVFVYPDGHIEDIQETFKDVERAIDYGKKLAIQVVHTEKIRNGIFRRKPKSYFMVVEAQDSDYRMVYDSRYPKRK